jgi:O-acetyl-ADP-ribose deacetylase (regulator of RNase III)
VKPVLAFFHPLLPFDHDRFPRNCLTHPLVLGRHHPLQVDAIVNAPNTSRLGGGRVDGAIHRAAGPELLAECRRLGGCPPGEARVTDGYRLTASHIIHTVGPIWRGGAAGEQELLESCYRSCLDIAYRQGFREIAFPAIATGIYGFPREAAARIAVAIVGAHLAREQFPELVTFVCFDGPKLDAYRDALGAKAAEFRC